MPRIDDTKRITALWTLRAILRPKGFQRFRDIRSRDEEAILQTIGLENLIGQELDKTEWKRLLVLQRQKLERIKGGSKGQNGQNPRLVVLVVLMDLTLMIIATGRNSLITFQS